MNMDSANQKTMQKLEALLTVEGALNVPGRIRVNRDAGYAIILLPVVRFEEVADGVVRAFAEDGSYVQNPSSEPLESLLAALTKPYPATVKNEAGDDVPNPDLATDEEWHPIRAKHAAKLEARAALVAEAEAQANA
jgi:hypothetical protein